MYYSEHYSVTSLDVDMNDHIRPAFLIRYMQETANHQMRDRKPSYYDFFAEGKSFITTRMSLEIYGYIRQYDDLEVRSWTAGEKGATFFRTYEAYVGGELKARAVGEWVMVGINDQKIFRASEIDLSNYESGEVGELGIERKFRMPKDLEFKEVRPKVVEFSDCDMNLHMNNTFYTDLVLNRIDDMIKKEVTSINLRYRTEAPLGGTITVEMAECSPEDICDVRAEEAYAFRSAVDGKPNLECLVGLKATELSPFA